jgi:mannan endo-1,4-beta-mannosidase
MNRRSLLRGFSLSVLSAKLFPAPAVYGEPANARALGFRVMRTFASVQIGDPSLGNVDVVWDPPGDFGKGSTNGVYFQTWDSAAGHMVINDGPNGMPHLDAMIAAAAKHHVRLVVALVDNWNYNGGTVEYCAWRHLPSVALPGSIQSWCPDFYTDPSVRADFKTWTAALLNRRNTVTGVLYKADPTIMTWELTNEPAPDTKTLASWAADMAGFIHKIDHRHLIAIGEEGFGRSPAEFTQLLRIPNIDYGTLHMYPVYDQPAKTPDDCIPILKQYLALGTASDKPVVIEEFGWSTVHPDQAAVYTQWLNTIRNSGVGGWQFWVFYGHNKNGGFPPRDPSDGFNIYKDGSAVTKALSTAAFKIEKNNDNRR